MAGFWAGFGEQVAENEAQKKKTLDRLIQENLDRARSAKGKYAERKNVADNVVRAAEAMKTDYNISDEQALVLAEAYRDNLPRLKVALDTENQKRLSAVGTGLTGEDVMSYVSFSGDLTSGKDIDLRTGVERLMGLHTQELAKEPAPKREGATIRSLARAIFAWDPSVEAAKKMEEIKGPGGMSYAQLLEMEQAGFAPGSIYGSATAAGGVAFDYEYEDKARTTKQYGSALSTKLYDADLTDAIQFSDFNAGAGDKAKKKAEILDASTAMADLERSIVISFQGTNLSLQAGRRGILDDIYKRIDKPEELATLQASIESGHALSVIKDKNGVLTAEDVDSIIAGKPVEPTEDKTPVVEPKGSTPSDTVAGTGGSGRGDIEPETAAILEKGSEVVPSVVAEENIQTAVDKANEVVADEKMSAEEKADLILKTLIEDAGIMLPTKYEQVAYFSEDISDAIKNYGLVMPEDVNKALMTKALANIPK